MVANFPRRPNKWTKYSSMSAVKVEVRNKNTSLWQYIFTFEGRNCEAFPLTSWEIPTCNFRKIVSSNHQKKEKNVKNRLKKNPGHGKFCDDKLWRIFKKKIMNKAIKYIRKPLSFLKCTWIFYIGFIPMNYLISSR